MTQQNTGPLVYVGTYTNTETQVPGERAGIYVYRMDAQSGELTLLGRVTGIANPSFLALHPQGRYLYAVSEQMDSDDGPGGSVSAFALDAENGGLRFLNHQRTHGDGPCYVSVDPTGRWALVANYSSGSVAVLPIGTDGQLGAAACVIQHEGSSVHLERQRQPHAHAIVTDPAGRFVFVPDLGIDRLMIYQLNPDTGLLTAGDQRWAELPPGAGPRHLAFHPDGRRAYLINELGNTLTAFAYDARQGRLEQLGTAPTLPTDFVGENTCADVHVAPSGEYVYGSNRGHDSIAIFRIGGDDAPLTPVGHAATQGSTPRNFAIDPSGRFLFAANQRSDSIVLFRIDEVAGTLTPTGQVTAVPAPVCVCFQTTQRPTGSGMGGSEQ